MVLLDLPIIESNHVYGAIPKKMNHQKPENLLEENAQY
jgi:hypothetical protein